MTDLTDDFVSAYLSTHYPDSAHPRQQLFDAAYDIAVKIGWQEGITELDATIMRWAWDCSKTGSKNVALMALADACGEAYPYPEHVALIISTDGFLSQREREHTKNMSGEITVYRGCSNDELEGDEFGFSWTFDKEVAHFFADSWKDGKVITACLDVSNHKMVWLDTDESELIITNVCKKEVIKAEDVIRDFRRNMDWSGRAHITPPQAQKTLSAMR